jgi:hypothetical protein
MQGLSERQYAARVGLSRGAIQKAKESGRLVLHADGSIDAEASDRRRADNVLSEDCLIKLKRQKAIFRLSRFVQFGCENVRRKCWPTQDGPIRPPCVNDAETLGATACENLTFVNILWGGHVARLHCPAEDLHSLHGLRRNQIAARQRTEALIFQLCIKRDHCT